MPGCNAGRQPQTQALYQLFSQWTYLLDPSDTARGNQSLGLFSLEKDSNGIGVFTV